MKRLRHLLVVLAALSYVGSLHAGAKPASFAKDVLPFLKQHCFECHGGGKKLATDAAVPFLGEIPIDPRVAECGDAGDPIVHKYPDSPVAQAYRDLARTVVAGLQQTDAGPELPEMQF